VNRILRKIFAPKGDEVGENCIMTGFVTCIIRMIKSRRMRWARHVTRMVKKECVYYIGGKCRRNETTRKTKM
jgi:hypothetical protein